MGTTNNPRRHVSIAVFVGHSDRRLQGAVAPRVDVSLAGRLSLGIGLRRRPWKASKGCLDFLLKGEDQCYRRMMQMLQHRWSRPAMPVSLDDCGTKSVIVRDHQRVLLEAPDPL
jgi:hypothetical protein